MGSTWEVYSWQEVDNMVKYDYVMIYSGESWFRAILLAIKEKRTCGCVKIEWRGSFRKKGFGK